MVALAGLFCLGGCATGVAYGPYGGAYSGAYSMPGYGYDYPDTPIGLGGAWIGGGQRGWHHWHGFRGHHYWGAWHGGAFHGPGAWAGRGHWGGRGGHR